MSKSSVQDAFRAALKQSRINKLASVHTLRHSWATHLLEAGVNLRLIQNISAIVRRRRPAVYTHLTVKAEQRGARGHQSLHRQSLMVELADIFRLHGPQYRAKFADRMLPSHLRAMRGHRSLPHRSSRRPSLSLCANCQDSSLQLPLLQKPPLPKVPERSSE